ALPSRAPEQEKSREADGQENEKKFVGIKEHARAGTRSWRFSSWDRSSRIARSLVEPANETQRGLLDEEGKQRCEEQDGCSRGQQLHRARRRGQRTHDHIADVLVHEIKAVRNGAEKYERRHSDPLQPLSCERVKQCEPYDAKRTCCRTLHDELRDT